LATVVRTPDDRCGEVPHAVVGSTTPEDLLELVAEDLTNYKLPHDIQTIDPDRFPRNTIGKIVRTEIKA
jgi:acyl-CoA synthetase (AMP-forming)/AMP-acid ligase II